MINKNTPYSVPMGNIKGGQWQGSNDKGGNLLGQTQFLLQWQRQGQTVRGDTIHIWVCTVVDEGSRLRRQGRLAAVFGGRQCRRQ